MDIDKIVAQMTFEEKTRLLTGSESLATVAMEKYGIPSRRFADGPHGVRSTLADNCTSFPSLACLAATWNKNAAEKMGRHIAKDCIRHGVNMILGPGANIKRVALCGRNFEYFSEDPVLAGEMAAAYIRGAEACGVATSLKHFAANNQERDRLTVSAEIDERTLREIYLKPFEIAVKKGKPSSVMTSYNKINAVWAAENRHILCEILKREWNYGGVVVSDWGAVHDIARSVHAGLDLQMPKNENIAEELKEGIANGTVTEEEIDGAVKRVLNFVLSFKEAESADYDRDGQHRAAQEIATEGIVLLKNGNGVLPLTSEKYKKIAVVGEFAASPLIAGQGSAEVLLNEKYLNTPLDELRKALPDTEIVYVEGYKKSELPKNMLWPYMYSEVIPRVKDCDAVVLFAGSMLSEDTEQFDRNTLEINPNYVYYINAVAKSVKNTVVVLQSGGALAVGEWNKNVGGILQAYLGGEGVGKAIADVLTGRENPSGKLPETFPAYMRRDIDYPGDSLKVEYNEKLNVGYRYYDRHTDEIVYPFGHGLSYTEFSYGNLKIEERGDAYAVSLTVKNVGDRDGTEVVQLYVSDGVSTVTKPLKELKGFEKIALKRGEEKTVEFLLTDEELSYYNTELHAFTVENGGYTVLVGSSSQDIRLKGSFVYDGKMQYTVVPKGTTMIG